MASASGKKIDIHIKSVDGSQITLNVDGDEPVTNVKKMIHEQWGIHPDSMILSYNGGQLTEYSIDGDQRIIRNGSDIQSKSTIHQSPHKAATPSIDSAFCSQKEWQARAEDDDFDEDLHIVDPQSHFFLLELLEKQVVERSELFSAKGSYSVNSNLALSLTESYGVKPFDDPILEVDSLAEILKAEKLMQVSEPAPL